MNSRVLFMIRLFCLLAAGMPAGSAQTDLGVKAGFTASDIRMTQKGLFEGHMPLIAPHVGLVSKIWFDGSWCLQSELLYLRKGFRYPAQFGNGVEIEITHRFHSVSLPLLIGVQINHLNVAAGPEVEYMFSTSTRFPDGMWGNDAFLVNKVWMVNANLEAGYRSGRFHLGLRGSLALNPLLETEFTDVNGVVMASSRMLNVALQAALSYMIIQE